MAQSAYHKIVNDPVHGFITIDSPLIHRVLEHPWMQRLRRIRQLGFTHLVYPGAMHTRFQHVLGAMHLMSMAVSTLQGKGHPITEAESEAVKLAILLHDIGHGPFSHVLEYALVDGIAHEELSKLFIRRMNKEFGGALDLAIAIFEDRYSKKFLHQLVSGQLDMDRLDYLKRDSFFSGVSEGVIGSDRIIKMLNIHNDQLVVEEKGIFSIEKFLVARRLMYWQVYLHKTVLVAEKMLVQILERAKFLSRQGHELFATPALYFFLKTPVTLNQFEQDPAVLSHFALLDDDDVMSAIKVWSTHPDVLLSTLSAAFIHRRLWRIRIRREPFQEEETTRLIQALQKTLGTTDSALARKMIWCDSISNRPYSDLEDRIHILYANGEVKDISEASELFDLSLLHSTTTRYYVCYPKGLGKLVD